MICVINPETNERVLLSEDSYREMVRKYAAWRRPLENAIEVPDDFPAARKELGAESAVSSQVPRRTTSTGIAAPRSSDI